MKIHILEEAQQELESGVDYYNQDCPGLGFEFADEVYLTFDRIIDNPEAWHPLTRNVRRCLTRRFPYAVIYKLYADFILVVSIMHLHRHPQHWQNRIAE